MVCFAIATTMRIEEICRVRWDDGDARKKTVIVRDRKDPRHKDGNHQRVPLLYATGYDAWALIKEQGILTGENARIFPYSPSSVSTAFRRARRELEVEDLRFHDLRHEGTSRLFEAGFTIEQVALVTGHKDWKMLKRYTNLKPEDLHRTAARLQKRDLETSRDEDEAQEGSEKIGAKAKARATQRATFER
jgi:integrase